MELTLWLPLQDRCVFHEALLRKIWSQKRNLPHSYGYSNQMYFWRIDIVYFIEFVVAPRKIPAGKFKSTSKRR